jgi:hypothetical protein
MVRNLTEIGVAAGRSLQVWNEYFSKAQIQGIDLRFEAAVVRNLSPLRRVKLHICDVLSSENVRTLNFAKESMDVIIDDGPHERSNQEITLANFWTYLKPGGVYIIEDVDAQRGGLDFEENPDKLASFTKSVFAENHVFWVDTAIGHRAWEKWLQMSTSTWARSRRIHNSYLVVIRKRIGPIPEIKVNFGSQDDSNLIQSRNVDFEDPVGTSQG